MVFVTLQVDISHKPVSHREAVAEGKVLVSFVASFFFSLTVKVLLCTTLITLYGSKNNIHQQSYSTANAAVEMDEVNVILRCKYRLEKYGFNISKEN